MKTLKKIELATYDVEEMSMQEAAQVEGGFWWWLVGLIAGCICDEEVERLTGHDIGYWGAECLTSEHVYDANFDANGNFYGWK